MSQPVDGLWAGGRRGWVTSKDPDNYEVRILMRMGGWSVKHRDNTGRVRDKFFSNEEDHDRFVDSLDQAPRGYYH